MKKLEALAKIVISVANSINPRDIEEYEEGMYNLLDLPQNPKEIDRAIAMANENGLVVQDNRESNNPCVIISADEKTFIRFNLYDCDEPEYGNRGDINSLDMTRNVYYATLPKGLVHMMQFIDESGDNSPIGNGITYKSEEIYKNEPDKVCYISEYGLNDLQELIDEGKVLSDEELIAEGIGSSHNSIRKEIIEYFGDDLDDYLTENEITLEGLCDDIFQTVDWQYVATCVIELDY